MKFDDIFTTTIYYTESYESWRTNCDEEEELEDIEYYDFSEDYKYKKS